MQRTNQTSATEFIFLAFSTIQDLRLLLYTVFFLLYLGILLENVALLTVILVDSRLHIPMYFFLWNLTFLEVCNSLDVVPRMLAGILTGYNKISLAGCALQMIIFIFSGNGAIFVVVVMAYDRYVAVSNPLRYKTILSNTVCWNLLVAALATSLMMALSQTILAFSVPYCESNQVNHFFCDVAQVLILAFNCTAIFYVYEIVFNLIGILTFNIPFLIVLISYIYIVRTILRIRTSDGRRKAFFACSSHLSSVIVQYLCLVIIYLRPKSSFLWDKNRFFVVVFMYISSCANPIIYSLRNKMVQSAFRKTLIKGKHMFTI